MGRAIERVYFFHHTHTDIGYTHPQEEVAEQQAENIALAVKYCGLTEDRPPEARFAWTVETGWTLARFWERAGEEERSRFARYAREGRIQITAGYLHLTQLVPPELLIRSLEPVLAIAAACGVEVDTAMVSDVNGVNWFYAQLLPQIGVRYLNMAVNTARGGAPLPAQRPGGFWWESPGGDRLLVWNNEHYMTGSTMLNFPEAPSFDALQQYLRDLQGRGYPYDTVILPIQGYRRDNAIPNMAICDMVEQFNERAADLAGTGPSRPLCHLVTAGQALRDVAARFGDAIPVQRGAWPDWWDDGVASSAFETGLVRYAHNDLLTAEKAASLAVALGAGWPFPHQELERLREHLLLYDEHTWGWWRSVEDPYSLQTRALGHRKTSYAEDGALEGARYAERAVRVLAQQVAARSEDEQLILFNPLAWPRREVVRWNVLWRNPAHVAPTAVRVMDGTGHETPSQNHLLNYIGHLNPFSDLWVDFEAEVPALGYTIYRFQPTEEPVSVLAETECRVAENQFYRVEVDAVGRVQSLFDKELDRELAGPGPWHVNQLIYEEVNSSGGRGDLVENYPPFDFAPNRATVALNSPHEATTHLLADRFGVSLISVTSMPHFPSVLQEIRLDHSHKRVDFTTRFLKAEVEATEAVYIAFPLAIKPRVVRCDTSGGVFTPGSGQIPGTSTDWYNVLHGVQLLADDLALTWLCGEAPVVELGEMKTGKTPSSVVLDNGVLFSYALNNHWFTNFFARQGGEFTFRYRLLSAREGEAADLGRAGREMLTPFTAARIGVPSARGPGVEIVREPDATDRSTATFAEIVQGHASLDSLKPAHDGAGFVLRLHELDGKESVIRLRLNWPAPITVTMCDLLERLGKELVVEHSEIAVPLKPFGTASLRIRLAVPAS